MAKNKHGGPKHMIDMLLIIPFLIVPKLSKTSKHFVPNNNNNNGYF